MSERVLEPLFTLMIAELTGDALIAASYWSEVEMNYGRSKRHYHNLQHLDALTRELVEIKHAINEWEILLFSIAYHDIIYNPLRHDNEEKSAEFALKRMTTLHCSAGQVNNCTAQILATKKHTWSNDSDTNYFTDADLSILGSPPAVYKAYVQSIRKEYKLYPDFVYNPGRQKVLKHFLDMPAIFKTAHFTNKYESQARMNLQEELRSLEK